ncbi:hypothetical protein [Chitinophaga solisilvae]|uniref:Uncharacterized protein n=1 Tax=Chitinophaga solisilvae TaxID=1233460 RepID=A0A3S1D2E5_9BACT|nr:hypothetical protein [Chitinophaga solisilvae]NSL87085.1 hypothetical protein [Chitinophaga solisilvae]
MYLLFLGIFALCLFLVFLQYRSANRKRAAMLMPVRSASILKFNSYTSFGIMATIKFKDEVSPKVGERVQQAGDLYKITGVVETPVIMQPQGVWDCKLEKL